MVNFGLDSNMIYSSFYSLWFHIFVCNVTNNKYTLDYFFYFFSSEYVVCSVLNCISTLLFAYNYLNGTFREPGIIKKLL